MKLEVYQSLWGLNGSLHENVERIARAGYEGVESVLLPAPQRAELVVLARDHGLRLIILVQTSGDHARLFAALVREAADLGPASSFRTARATA